MKEVQANKEQTRIALQYFELLTLMIRQAALGMNREEINRRNAVRVAEQYRNIPDEVKDVLKKEHPHLYLLPHRVNDVQLLFEIKEGVLL